MSKKKKVICDQCGESMMRTPCQIKFHNFCNNHCCLSYQRARRKRRRDKRIKREYTLEDKRWAQFVKERDGYECQECGCTDVELLNAHHIIPYDDEKRRYNVGNGVCLCIECHAEKHPRMKAKMLEVMSDILKKREE